MDGKKSWLSAHFRFSNFVLVNQKLKKKNSDKSSNTRNPSNWLSKWKLYPVVKYCSKCLNPMFQLIPLDVIGNSNMDPYEYHVAVYTGWNVGGGEIYPFSHKL